MSRIEELEVDDETEETHPRALSPHLLYDAQDVLMLTLSLMLCFIQNQSRKSELCQMI